MSDNRKTLEKRIRTALDPLRARLRRTEIVETATRIAAANPATDLSDLALALALLDVADDCAAVRGRLVQEMDQLASALAAHGQEAAPALLREQLERQDASAGDIRAIDRGLDAAALGERQARLVGRNDGTRELCLAAAGTLAADAFSAARVAGQRALPAPLAPEGQLPARLIGHGADDDAPWTVRVAALEGAARLIRNTIFPLAPRLVDQLDELADDAADHRWVQVAATRALGAASPARARARVRARVLMPRGTPDDGLVRAKLLVLFTGELADPQPGPALVAAAGDPSELVRQAAARACRVSGDLHVRDLLAAMVDPGREKQARVRGVAAAILADRVLGSAGEPERLPAAETLARVVCTDPDDLARRVACDVAAKVAATGEGGPAATAILRAALETARTGTFSPDVANAVARAAERASTVASPERARLRGLLAEAIASLPEKGQKTVRLPEDLAALPEDEIGRVLAELAQGDFGLYAKKKARSLVLRRGDRTERKAWRLLHEITHPIPSKRQGYLHTIGRVMDLPMRAHPGGMAEVTRTRVPGERVYISREGSWAPYLPMVDDLLAAAGGDPARLYSEHGITLVTAPDGVTLRMSARTELTRRYAELADLRIRSLEAADAAGRAVYLETAAKLGVKVRFQPYAGCRPPRHVRELFPVEGTYASDSSPLDPGPPIPVGPGGGSGWASRLPMMLPLGSLHEPLSEAARVIGNRDGGGIAELAAFTAGTAVLFAGRALATRVEVSHHRRQIPLVIGGWGTRGKSGVERLKAGLFHGLGYEVISKTTGCEATILVGIPGRPLVEVPLFRPYDKATIWEQRDVLRFAGTRKPHVLLWECMALNPKYVDLLQRGWMRDDISTLTNAYPDHEDVQGPAGIDVARVISGFTPENATLVTAEDQMLPVIKERARERKSKLVTVGPWEHELIAPELLARFPYQEHPRNVALVAAMAEELGLDRDVAIAEMADHVLADIGGLRSYGPFPFAGRKMRFSNGMSANERASALGNWRRLGYDAHRADADPGRFIVGFVNNRADRAARSLTFAECVVEDLAAHRFVLVGTNTAGLKSMIEGVLDRRLERLRAAEVEDVLTQMKIGDATPAAAIAEVATWAASATGSEKDALAARLRTDRELAVALEGALHADQPEELSDAKRAVERSGATKALEAALRAAGVDAALAAELATHATDAWARRRIGAACRRNPAQDSTKKALRSIFLASVSIPADPTGPADDLIDEMARLAPPGATVDIMGLQNIKGPGLATIYRFAAAEKAQGDVTVLANADADEREARDAAVRRLRELDGVGRHVLSMTATALEKAAAALTNDERQRAEGLARTLQQRATLAGAGSTNASAVAAARSPWKRTVRWVTRGLDHIPSVRRRRSADEIFDDLARSRVGTERAAREVDTLLAEQRK